MQAFLLANGKRQRQQQQRATDVGGICKFNFNRHFGRLRAARALMASSNSKDPTCFVGRTVSIRILTRTTAYNLQRDGCLLCRQYTHSPQSVLYSAHIISMTSNWPTWTPPMNPQQHMIVSVRYPNCCLRMHFDLTAHIVCIGCWRCLCMSDERADAM